MLSSEDVCMILSTSAHAGGVMHLLGLLGSMLTIARLICAVDLRLALSLHPKVSAAAAGHGIPCPAIACRLTFQPPASALAAL